jgi:hypothetical protein
MPSKVVEDEGPASHRNRSIASSGRFAAQDAGALTSGGTARPAISRAIIEHGGRIWWGGVTAVAGSSSSCRSPAAGARPHRRRRRAVA